MAGGKIEIAFPFEDAPDWLANLVFSREGDDIVIEAVRRNGYLLGKVQIGTVRFNQVADILLAEGS
jgi:hypothetical protein